MTTAAFITGFIIGVFVTIIVLSLLRANNGN